MKRLFNNLCLLMLVILLIPYFLTTYMTGSTANRGKLTSQNIDILYHKNAEEIHLNLEEYIAGAVAAAMPSNYEPEALKAQAVILRTFVAGTEFTESSVTVEDLGFTYLDKSELEVIWEADEVETLYSKILKAVDETKNEVLYYKNELISPLFHSASVGTTRNASEVLGEGYSYLQSVESGEDTTSSDYMCITEETTENIIKKLNSAYDCNLTEENFSEKMLILERDSLGYIKTAEIDGLKLTGEEIADCLSLNSSNFYFQDYEGKIRIICKGKGHGFGLSQYFANELAKKGMNYKEILNYFYSDIKINKIK